MKQPIILCDIDGTVADITHRLHYISNDIVVGDIVSRKFRPTGREFKGEVLEVSGYIEVKWSNLITELCDRSEIKKVKSYNKFFSACTQDSPLQTNIEMVKVLSQAYPIVFVSGRPDSVRQETGQWLIDNGLGYVSGLNVPILQTRKAGDYRKDCEIKQEIYEQHLKENFDVILVLDDRQQCVDMWRSLGLTCWQVNKGDF